MIYFLLVLCFVVYIIYFLFKKSDEKILAGIRWSWGKPTGKYLNFDSIKEYATLDQTNHFHKLTSQTLKDIDIESLFTVLNRTMTTVGQQILYAKIIFPKINLEELKQDDKNSDYFKAEVRKRESVQLILYRLETNGTSRITKLLKQKDPVIGRYLLWYKILTGLMIIGILCSLVYPIFIVLLIGVAAVNITVQYIFKYRNEMQYKAAGEVYALVKAATRLQKIDTIVDSASIPGYIRSLKSFIKNYRFLNFAVQRDDLAMAVFYMLELAKACFLLEVHRLNKLYSQIVKGRDSIKELYKYIGEFDMAISMASLKSDANFKTCIPDLIQKNKILKSINITHPLIENCVANSLSLELKSAFITGSNMSGKSTFLRTVLINSILAQTLYICFAESFTSSFMKSFSSITIEDDLLRGSSYFFEEVEIIKVMTEQASLFENNLFIIDETFKGTNTLERISLAKAVLEFLNNNHSIVIASSHDLELIELLSKDFEMFYFTEDIQESSLNFDHTIKEGYLKTTNAIKIIEIENYPQSIIDEANKMTMEYEAGKFMNIEK